MLRRAATSAAGRVAIPPYGTAAMFGPVTEFVIDLVRTLFERWGYLVVFLALFLENALFLGVVVPGVFVLLLAGLSAHAGLIDIRIALLLALLGTSTGDTFSYLAGRFGWKRALHRAEQLPFMHTVRETLARRHGLFVLSYHFFGYTRLLGPMMAGVLKLSFRRWFLTDLAGAAVWVSVYMIAGYLLGEVGISLETAEDNARKLEWLLLGMAVLSLLLFTWSRKRRRSRPALAVSDDGPGHTPA